MYTDNQHIMLRRATPEFMILCILCREDNVNNRQHVFELMAHFTEVKSGHFVKFGAAVRLHRCRNANIKMLSFLCGYVSSGTAMAINLTKRKKEHLCDACVDEKKQTCIHQKPNTCTLICTTGSCAAP